MKRATALALSSLLVLALAPAAVAAPAKAGRHVVHGRSVDLHVKIVEYDPGSGFGRVVFTTSGGSWSFRPEIDDEVILGVTMSGTASFAVRHDSKGLPYLKYGDIQGEAQLVGGKDKVEFSKVLLTTPGERGFYIDDFIIGVLAKWQKGQTLSLTWFGSMHVRGLLLPAVQ